jgi:DNA-binding IclR family transcriptional regulator
MTSLGRVRTITERISDYVNGYPGSVGPGTIAMALGLNVNTVRGALGRLRARGQIRGDGRGQYCRGTG